MKGNESLYSEERQQRILEILKEKKRVTVKGLVEMFNISGVTIRNDLNLLSRIDGVVRTHGGAIFVEQFRTEFVDTLTDSTRSEPRGNFEKVISQFISDGDVVFIDARLANRNLIDALQEKQGITVVTDSIQAAQQLALGTGIQTIIPGGRVKGENLTVHGTRADVLLEGGNISKAFFAAWGFSIEDGLTDNEPQAISFKRSVAEISRLCVGVLDSGCLNRVSLHTFLDTSSIDALVIDRLPSEMLHEMDQKGIRVIVSGVEAAAPSGRPKLYSAYEQFRCFAMDGISYAGRPGRGKKIAFANCNRTPFCMSLEQSVLEQAKLAGFRSQDILLLNNDYDPGVGLRNAERVLEESPDIFVEFQMSFKVNNIISNRFKHSGIPIIGVEVPVPGAPYVGVDNWQSALLGGGAAAKLIRKCWGSWDAVDLVVLFQVAEGGEAAMLRVEGFADELNTEFGENTEDKIVRADIGTGRREELKRYLSQLYAAHPQANRLVLTSITEASMAEILSIMREMGRWKPENYIVVTHGCDQLAQQHIRQGLFTAAIAHFPEKYGEYVVPAACALLQGEAVPPYIFVKNVVVTRDNIDVYYSQTNPGGDDR